MIMEADKHMETNDCLSLKQTLEAVGEELPNAVELEKCVLGALMVDPNALYWMIDKIPNGLFYNKAHRLVFGAIRGLYEDSRKVDMVTVIEELRREGFLEQAGGALYVSQLASGVMSAAHIETHVAFLTEKYYQRELIRTATEIIRDAHSDTCDPVETLDRADRSILGIYDCLPQDETVTIADALGETINLLESSQCHENGICGVPSGYKELDRMTKGFRPGTLTVLASLPAMGKTSCALIMALNMAARFHYPVLFFSPGMSVTDLVLRTLSLTTGLTLSELRDYSTLSKEHSDKLYSCINKVRETPLFLDDTDDVDIARLRAICRRMRMEQHIRMVIIDGFQFVAASRENGMSLGREKNAETIARHLKSLSKELAVPVLVTAQLSRRAEYRPNAIPRLSDLKESDSLSGYADNVFALHRPWMYGDGKSGDADKHWNQAVLYVMKHNSGDTGTVNINLNEGCDLFPEIQESMTAPPARTSIQSSVSSAGSVSDVIGNEEEPDDDLPF